MKEVKTDFEGMPYISIVPTCDTCKKRGGRLEMVAPAVTGMVDICKDRRILRPVYPERCQLYQMNLKTRISEIIKLS